MDKIFFLSTENLPEFLTKLSVRFEVFVPVKSGQKRFYKKFDFSDKNMVIGEVRAFEPLKAFFSRGREVVAQGFTDAVPSPTKPFAIVGVKACDLQGFKIQDFVFYPEGNRDPVYSKNRENNLIIAADCTCAIPTCFCLALGVKPFPVENFDINLSQVANGFVVEVGSAKGEKVVSENSALFTIASSEAVTERENIRQRVIMEVERNLREYDVPRQETFKGSVERNYKAPVWEDEAKTCVECGCCNTVCPTCHCFLLYDQKDQERMARFRIWDSCLIKDFARVAGGGNPRPKLWMRLRNRFEKKFDFFPKLSGVYACTGCGRCILGCPAKIDIRKVLRRLVNNV